MYEAKDPKWLGDIRIKRSAKAKWRAKIKEQQNVNKLFHISSNVLKKR